ncbi:Bax inhibitor-1/YccA family protein [Actinomyces vulturis]|uniref:Bax inhibitor-1/YccA family protein n=1 Tax=Actinomyces vulturis TaxID=1857645 RepID=UPI0008363681|nr:Bax inhibitor-1/YccA family protein [Actinomyces vulturis]
MSNPFFTNNPAFKESKGGIATATPAVYPIMPGYQPGTYGQPLQGIGQVSPGYGSVPAQDMTQLERQYAAPSATNVDRERMTYDDVVIRTSFIFAIIVGSGALSWMLSVNQATLNIGMVLTFIGVLGGLVFGLINSFKREPSVALIVLYGVFEGLALGGISGIFEMQTAGIVLQAVLATFATFAVMLGLYSFAGFRVSGKVAKVLFIAMGGYLLFSLVNLALMVTGVVNDPWGLRGSVEVMGIPLGVILGVVVVVMAALSLVLDFQSIDNGVKNGLPRKYAWSCAFGLVVTIVWLYLEFLRLLAILNRK